ncbi:ATP-dependent RNA helicase DHX30 [Nerophis ophidion]|uniref:ATP-dependent RNA helicase DHX30 n=1 Tax=Nerophis ophidion TaxID=159077 RepID=UPI002ADFF90B|nr:ATP-dependent RNA helicase DHX30 [Nerophis ophidion]
MAQPGVLLVRVRALCRLSKCLQTGGPTASNWGWHMRWCQTPTASFRVYSTSHFQYKEGNINSNLLDEFPDPKCLLHNTISRSSGVKDLSHLIQYTCTEGDGVKRATVTVLWPCKFEKEGFASRKVDAERFAAAAACHQLKEMGVIGRKNQLPRNSFSRWRGVKSSLYDVDEDPPIDEVQDSTTELSPPLPESRSDFAEALSLFPSPIGLLSKVLQVATGGNNIKEQIEYNISGGKLKSCELTLRWPQEMTFTARASNKGEAKKRAAALACMRLKELQLLDGNNNPLTHAGYHKEKVREAAKSGRRALQVQVPDYLKECMREYLAQYPVDAELLKLCEEGKEEQIAKEEDNLVIDAITGKPYRPLSPQEVQYLNDHLQNKWKSASPGLSVTLPVDSHRQRVISAVQSSRAVVIAGETGCGKTTRIPRFLLEECVMAGQGAQCNILVTQPRRISAVSVAQRVAQEMGPALKRSVGYQVRLESRPPEQSAGALLFLTVGVLLRKLQSNPTLKGISHVVVDEVHERDVNTDLLLALLRSTMEKNADLRVVLMSATGDNQRLARYFGDCVIVKVPGFMHPVQEKYLEDILGEMGRRLPVEKSDDASPDLDLVADVIEHIDRHGQPGAVLCFLPGWQDIRTVQQLLEMKPHFSFGSQMILPLHSSLSVADQQAVFDHPQEGRRKIVLATNIAETAITIDDIVHVVDSGSHKEHSYDPCTKVSCLDTVWISQSNVTQRKGRAGRCQPGQSYHLFSRKHLDSMSLFPIPEILRTPLESLVVQAKIHSPKCKAVEFLSQVLDSPEQGAVADAVQNLQDIGVLDRSETLTSLGERVASMSCDPRLGKVLVLSTMFRCVLPILSIAACLTRDPFYNSLQNRSLVTKAKAKLSGSSCSDYLVFSRAVLGWRRLQQEGYREERDDYLQTNILSRPALRFINGLISQFSDNLREAQLVSHANECQRYSSRLNEHSEQEQLLKALLLAGLYPNLIQVKKGLVAKGGRFRPNRLSFRTLSGQVLLHRSSVNKGNEALPCRWLTFFGAVKSSGVVFIRDSSAVHPLALLLLTDCDINETVSGNMVEVSFHGRSLVRCQLAADTWELLWELRTSIQAMLQRNLSNPRNAAIHQDQDGKLVSLLVNLLNDTNQKAWACNDRNDTEVD